MRRSAALLTVWTVCLGLLQPAGARPERPALPGLTQLEAIPADAGERMIGVAVFGGKRPDAARLGALRRSGLVVQAMTRLPMALLYGTKDRLVSAARRGLASDVYPNERLEWLSKESRKSMRVDRVPTSLTGKGVGVAIVDSGIDATHPDLADHVTHNVKLVGPEYLGVTGMTVDPDTPPGTIVIPVDQGPYNNSDLGSGHGTHVAGIVAADGTTTDAQVGVAPDASLIGYSTGDVLYIFTIIAAFDHILANHEEWDIRVVNNSWGSAFRLFDPNHPIHAATKALHDAGIVVSFSAGNSTAEMQVNPWSVAPWVISAGSATVSRERSDFSSGGMEFDNSQPVPLPSDDHLSFHGDRVGIYHPDVTGPGSNIVSSGTPGGAYVGPTPPGGSTPASGTSMSSPHVAGLAALLLQARPDLTPAQVREIMQVTAAPMRDASEFWRSGYGFVDAAAAIELVRRPDFGPKLLGKLQAAADEAVQADRAWRVRSADYWAFVPLPATAFGLDSYTYEVEVPAATKAVKATVAYPILPLLPNLVHDYAITVKDAAGSTVAESASSGAAGLSSLFMDLVNPTVDEDGKRVPPPAVKYGTWTVEVAGVLGSQDPTDVPNKTLSVAFVQLTPQVRIPRNPIQFIPTGKHTLFFQPEGETGPLTSPEGCEMETGAPAGGLAATKFTAACHAGSVGYATNYGAGIPAEFTSAPLADALVIGGPSALTLYLADSAQPAYGAAFASRITYALDALDAAGNETALGGGSISKTVVTAPEATRSDYAFAVPPVVVDAGSRLRLRLQFSGFYTSTMRFLYGGDYADAGVTLSTGGFVLGGRRTASPSKPAPSRRAGGSDTLPATGTEPGFALVAMLGVGALLGRRALRRTT